MRYESFQDKVDQSLWRVEAIETEGDGDCHVVVFSSPKAEQMAIEYAEWKNGEVKSEPAHQRSERNFAA